MKKILKEEFLRTITRRRFLIPFFPLLFGPLIGVLTAKSGHWNDLVFFLDTMDYLRVIFLPMIGSFLLISVYRRKYTRSSIRQANEHGQKRSVAVFARWLSGVLILCACYIAMALFLLILGCLSGAGMSTAETGMLAVRLITDCAAAVATYTVALFFLYLFAFPLVPVLLYILFSLILPEILLDSSLSFSQLHHVMGFLLPKMNSEILYTALVLSNPQPLRILLFLPHTAIPLLLTMLIFRLKKEKH